MTPLEELKLLEAQIARAGDLEALKPIFYRLDEIAKENSGDFEVQLAASDLRQRLLDRGNLLRKAQPPPPPVRPAPAPAVRRSQSTPRPAGSNRGIWVAGAAVLVLLLAAGGVALRKRAAARALAKADIPFEIVTVPPGAAISVNGAAQCTSDCRLSFPAGNYQVTAALDGYEPAASTITLVAGKPASLVLPLEAHVALRILSDQDQGKVTVDGQPAVDLTGGQYVLTPVPPGMHSVKVTSKTGEASLTFEAYNSTPPVIGTVAARNFIAVALASFGSQAHLVSSSGPLKLAVNGQPEADAVPTGIDLKAFQPAVNELVIGEGKDQRSIKESFGSTPMLTVFLKSDVNAGTLIVSTGEDEVRVLLNGKEYRRKTEHGELRIQTLGTVNVQVAKDGFDPVAPLTAEVKKGAETRLEFKLNRTPTTATLQIAGAMPGTEVFIDQHSDGVVAADGGFSDTRVAPGDHAIELRREHFVAKRYQRTFNAGQTVAISGPEVLLVAERLPPPPPPPEKKPEPVIAKAPPPAPAGTVADFEDAAQWHAEGSSYVHRGAGFLAFKMPPQGTFTFTVQPRKGGLFREGKVRWRLMYTDNRNFAEFEIDKSNFICRVVQDGKAAERTRTSLKDIDKQKEFTIQIDVTPEHIVHKLRAGGSWVPLDAWSEPGVHFAEGKFGFFLPGNDEIALTNFKFQPK
ncbi:MAG: PEGA domain-containing protein [Bryobacterales bacterium]|nr:PEGA domain-containing protein [Bryobacterales bacterium]